MVEHVSLNCSCSAVVTYNLPKEMKKIYMHTDKDWQGMQGNEESFVMVRELIISFKRCSFP